MSAAESTVLEASPFLVARGTVSAVDRVSPTFVRITFTGADFDEFGDPDDIPVKCVINDVIVQESTTADLIFSVPELIAYLSAVLPCDVILTGTPSGVGLGRTPPSYLVPGDVIETTVGDQTMRHIAIAQPQPLKEA